MSDKTPDIYLARVKLFMSAASFNLLSHIVRNPGQDAKQIGRSLNNQPGQYISLLKEAKLIEAYKDYSKPVTKGKTPNLYRPTWNVPTKRVRSAKVPPPDRPKESFLDNDPKSLISELNKATSETYELWPIHEIRRLITHLNTLL